jgi:large subunit ribosomal protein L28
MSRKCEICGKVAVTGSTISRRGLAKKKGGVGKKITGVSTRRFFPNIQQVTVTIGGKRKRFKACASCIKAGKIMKA